MQTSLQLCKSVSLLNSSRAPCTPDFILTRTGTTCHAQCLKSPSFPSFTSCWSLKTLSFSKIFRLWRVTHVSFCSYKDPVDDLASTQLPEKAQKGRIRENDELELLNKPSPVAVDNDSALESDKESKKIDKDEALAPFLKFFKPRDSMEEVTEREGDEEQTNLVSDDKGVAQKLNVDYYEPKPGDFVVGVVVSGNENKLDVNVGADLLGTMLTKEVLPLYDKEMEYLSCDVKKDTEVIIVKGRMGIVKDEAALGGGPGPGRPVVETGTVLFAEVLGRTLSGRPLLSTRRLFRRIAWHRVRQIKELNEPIEVKITEWNTGGLLTRIEGLRAFLPKVELLNKVKNFKELKENVGRRIHVLITRINEANNDLILSEREAWEMLNLQEGTLLEGTVKKIFPYGAQIRIGETNRSGLLHVSNISRTRITAVEDVLKVDEKVKVLVVKSMFPEKISVSIADLESEPGLFLSDKEKFFAEVEEMAKKYRQKLPAVMITPKSGTPPCNALAFSDEATFYANWKWFQFERN